MFAPLVASALHESLVSHVFGRLVASPSGAAANNDCVGPALSLVSTASASEGEEVDLAQRVRESGEW